VRRHIHTDRSKFNDNQVNLLDRVMMINCNSSL
jgi:hypothetical protein